MIFFVISDAAVIVVVVFFCKIMQIYNNKRSFKFAATDAVTVIVYKMFTLSPTHVHLDCVVKGDERNHKNIRCAVFLFKHSIVAGLYFSYVHAFING